MKPVDFRVNPGSVSHDHVFYARGGGRYVLHVVADDLGYDDVGWRNGQTITPPLDGLVKGGAVKREAEGGRAGEGQGCEEGSTSSS